jgi:aminomethyltransferase
LYTTWCDEHGKVIDDGTLARLGEQHFRLTSAEPALRWLHMNGAGMEVQIEDVSDQVAALALQGPLSREVLAQLAPAAAADLAYFRTTEAKVRDIPVTISRTGYTGDLGYELFVPAERATELWDILMLAGVNYGITPAGIWALDVARIEAGLLMGGVDYHSAHHALIDTQYSSPYELNLGWTVNPRDRPFNGARALRDEAKTPALWKLVGVDVDWTSLEALHLAHGLPPALPSTAWRTSTPIYADGNQIGYASSGCWSPLLKKYLALAHIRAPHFAPGTRVGFEVTVEHERRQAGATITRLPFLDLPRKRL